MSGDHGVSKVLPEEGDGLSDTSGEVGSRKEKGTIVPDGKKEGKPDGSK